MRKIILGLMALLLAPLAAPAAAAVVGADAHGFEIRHSVDVALAPPRAYALFGRIGSWWSKDHSYSGDAANLTLDLRPGGCFCERLGGGGGVEHLRIAYLVPGERIVLTGSLGPLLYEATAAVLDVTFAAKGKGTTVTMTYRAAGFARGNADTLSTPVDQVLGEQVKRYAAIAAR